MRVRGAVRVERIEDDMNSNSQKNTYFAGPLNLNRSTKQADTVTGYKLSLNENEFNALDLLVSRAGEMLTFEQIYEAAWQKEDGSDNREAARIGFEKLIKQVRKAGEGFMWIEYTPEFGYSFRTYWGHNWHTRNNKILPPVVKIPNARSQEKKTKRSLAPILTAVCAAAAVFAFVITTYLYDPNPGGQIIDEGQIPLAEPNLDEEEEPDDIETEPDDPDDPLEPDEEDTEID